MSFLEVDAQTSAYVKKSFGSLAKRFTVHRADTYVDGLNIDLSHEKWD